MSRTWFFAGPSSTEDREAVVNRLAAQDAELRALRQAVLGSEAVERPALRFSL
jgi:hypothetical protein